MFSLGQHAFDYHCNHKLLGKRVVGANFDSRQPFGWKTLLVLNLLHEPDCRHLQQSSDMVVVPGAEVNVG